MEVTYHLPLHEVPAAIPELVQALREQKLKARHEKKSWGDWLHLESFKTVISTESLRGLTRSVTVEFAEGESEELELRIISAFRSLGWYGIDEDGEYRL